MTDINAVFLVGRLTKDVQVKYSTSGVAIATFSIANNQSRKEGDSYVEQPHYFDAIMFGKRADALQKYLTKGQQVALQGSLSQNRWQDKQTGANRSKVEILVNDIQLIGAKKDSGQSNGGYSSTSTAPSNVSGDFDDDIPF